MGKTTGNPYPQGTGFARVTKMLPVPVPVTCAGYLYPWCSLDVWEVVDRSVGVSEPLGTCRDNGNSFGTRNVDTWPQNPYSGRKTEGISTPSHLPRNHLHWQPYTQLPRSPFIINTSALAASSLAAVAVATTAATPLGYGTGWGTLCGSRVGVTAGKGTGPLRSTRTPLTRH